MLLTVVAFLLVLSVPLRGGRLGALTDLRLRAGWLLLPALLLQIVITEVASGGARLPLAAAHVASYLCAGVVLWRNRRVPGLPLLGAGALLNAGAISLNGGSLPASPWALRVAGRAQESHFANSAVLPHPHLAFLGDIIPTPSWLPLANVLSVGDLLIVAGAGWLLHAVCRPAPSTPVRCLVAAGPGDSRASPGNRGGSSRL